MHTFRCLTSLFLRQDSFESFMMFSVAGLHLAQQFEYQIHFFLLKIE